MKRRLFLALVLLSVMSTAGAAQTDDAFWKRILRWFGWSQSAIANTRGAAIVTDVYGELLLLDRESDAVRPLLAGHSVRSAVVTPDGKRVFALSSAGLVEGSLTGAAQPRLHALAVEPERLVRLLAYNEDRLLALTQRGCIVAITPSEGKPSVLEHDVSEKHRENLLTTMRTCGDETLGERNEAGGPARRDVFVARAGTSKVLTRQRAQRFNADPIFEPGCKRVLFISRERE